MIDPHEQVRRINACLAEAGFAHFGEAQVWDDPTLGTVVRIVPTLTKTLADWPDDMVRASWKAYCLVGMSDTDWETFYSRFRASIPEPV